MSERRWSLRRCLVGAILSAFVGSSVPLAADAQEARRRYEGHRGAVTCLQFAPDERHFLSGGEDGRVYYVDSRSWEIVQEFKGHEKPVRSLRFREDGKEFVSAGDDGVVRIHSLAEQRELGRLELKGKEGCRAVFVPGKTEVVIGTSQGTVHHWDFNQAREIRSWTGHKEGIADLAVSKDGKNVFTVDLDGSAANWLLEDGRVVRELTTLNEPFTKREPLRGVRGEYTITAGPRRSGFLEALGRLAGGNERKDLYPSGAFSENGRQLLLTKVCTVDIQGRWFDPGQPPDPPAGRAVGGSGTPFDVFVLPFSAFADILGSLTRSSGRAPAWRQFQKTLDAPQFLLQDPGTGALGKRFFGSPGPGITALDLVDGGNRMALGCRDGSVWVCTTSTRQVARLSTNPAGEGLAKAGGKDALAVAPDSSAVTAVALNRGGRYAVVGHATGEVRLWAVNTRRLVQPAK
ncbi:MAG: hypothetical protein NZM31_04145 [Gemmatales bacterium]|nr:hypothetical protein [Gemmatales bacterium]MDW8386191.1 WD40 repeat domain-containing protein [Gemmatales bacterium]